MRSRKSALLCVLALGASAWHSGHALAATIDSVNAKYNARKGEVKVNGSLAQGSPSSVVRLYDDLTNNLLGTGTFSEDYKFTLKDFSTHPAPCAVRVEAGDAPLTSSVRDAPANCSQFAGSSVTLAGVVRDDPIPYATVTVTVGGVTYTTVADANGEFVIQIAGIDLSSLVLIESSGPNPLDESLTVDLVSIAGTLAKLVEDADENGIVDGTENPNINNTPYTTALFVLLGQANGGETPETLEELQTAERSVDASELLELAAVIKLLVDDPSFEIPVDPATGEPYATIIEFLSDTSLDESGNTPVENFIATNEEAVNTATVAILNDAGITPAFTAAGIPDRYYVIQPAQVGYVSRQGQALEFNGDFTGRTLESFQGEPQPGAYNWQVTDGRLVLDFTQSPGNDTWVFNEVDLANTLRCREPDNTQFLSCPHTCEDYQFAFANKTSPDFPVFGSLSSVQRAFTRYGISAGGAREFVQVEHIFKRDYEPFEYDPGTTGPLTFEFCDEFESAINQTEFVNADANPPRRLEEDSFAGKTLAIPVYYDPDNPAGGFAKGLHLDFVTLENGVPDGSGHRAATTLLSNVSVEWRISEGGGPAADSNGDLVPDGDRLELRYAGGELQTLRQIDPSIGLETGYFIELNGVPEPFGNHDIVIEVDPAFSFSTNDYIVNTPGEVWLGMINSWAKLQWEVRADGTLAVPGDFAFGWEFLAGGAGFNHFAGGGGSSSATATGWELLAGDTDTSVYGSTLNPVPAGTLLINRPNRKRFWVPIAGTTVDTPNPVENAAPLRERFYNLEFEYFLNNGGLLWIAPRINSEEVFFTTIFPHLNP
jgi:hypothetical protein